MQNRNLGRHSVGAIGLGAMSFGGMFGPTTMDESFATLDAAHEMGLSHIDTANIYGMGRSEEVIGAWAKSRNIQPGTGPIIATKASIVSGPSRRIDNSAAHLRAELEASLKRLGRDHVELFYLHRREAERPLEEVIETMARLIDEGKIGGYGLSEVAPSTIREAHALLPVTAVQNEYSLWSRQPELGVIRACNDLGITFVPFSPLGRGMFANKPLAAPEDGFRRANPRFSAPNFARNTAIIDGFRRFSQSRGWTTSAAALAWVLAQDPKLLPIPATRYAAHLKEWKQATEIRFSAEDLAEIDRLLPPGFAHGDRYSHAQYEFIERYS